MSVESTKKHARIEDFNKMLGTTKPLEREPFNLDTRRQMTILHGLRYVAFGLLILIVLFLGSRYLGDLAIASAYPNVPLTWIGFSAIVYLILSVLILPLDFYTRFNLGIKSGLHSMPWYNIIGRWARATFIDTIGWAILSYITFDLYAKPWFMTDKIKAVTDTGLLVHLFKLSLPWILLSIVVIPLWFIVRDTLVFLTGNGFTPAAKLDENSGRVRLLGKRYKFTILGISYYSLSGDYTAETKLVGMFGLYWVFLPETLHGKDAVVASASKAMAQAQSLKGTVTTAVNWLAFCVGTMLSYFGFHLSYKILYPMFTWPSEAAGTADPSLFFWMLLSYGLVFLIAKFVNNQISKAMNKVADKTAQNGVEQATTYAAYLRAYESGIGFASEREPLTDMFLTDTYAPDKAE